MSEDLGVVKPSNQSTSGRLKLWNIKEAIHCSVVGTCASVSDIKRLAAKVGINLIPDACDYAVHGFLVQKTTEDCTFARAFQKLMDNRHAGALRKVKGLTGQNELEELWCSMRDSGLIASAYWAFMTSAHVPLEVRELVFGEVHMFSHLAGANYARKSGEVDTLELELAELGDKLDRLQKQKEKAIQTRDETILWLREQRDRARASVSKNRGSEINSLTADKALRKIEKLERALISARSRARHVEMANTQLKEKYTSLTRFRSLSRESRHEGTHCGHVVTLATSDKAEPLRVLYVGGRSRQIPRLRGIAEQQSATLIHHDGGKEDAVQRMDSVLSSVDCVMCPVDCVSHDACLRAKHFCAKQKVPFFPLRTSSLSAFENALLKMRAAEAGRGAN